MTRPRQAQPRPVPMTPEEDAERERQFRELDIKLNRYTAGLRPLTAEEMEAALAAYEPLQ